MYKGPLSLLALILLVACNNAGKPKVDHDTTRIDTQTIRDVYPKKTDSGSPTIKTKEQVGGKSTASDDQGESPRQIIDEYVAKYNKPCVIDSSFSIGSDLYSFHSEHVCLMDSGITVPRTYVSTYKIDSFVTHNFVSRVRLAKNGHIILERTIQKKDFEKILYPELRIYGTLFCPTFHLNNGNILLHYSISIPLTDVGLGAYAAIAENGHIDFKNDN